ncbi:proline dehydrogenase Ecym_4224 [Eremothecium cymbalariae DBVPG|uniref:Proline dehydrogenase n=1 Tax=Eremothecium cymbalariae (strain CBS 270.75 / DBVPG 7215 / KCTC 17166 / NRRL Y-17582) TaxID=931890 RepID=G8JTD8_ERECY|nr:hypothetical protein Ecym_4224 [Eremothecium cymbalariae DBVPG\
MLKNGRLPIAKIVSKSVKLDSGISGAFVRGYVSHTQSKQSTIAIPPAQVGEKLAPPSAGAFLKPLSTKELLSLGAIGCATINDKVLNSVIKVFPYVPSSVVKMFVSSLYCGGDNIMEAREKGKMLRGRGINNMMLSLTIEDCEGIKNIDINYIVEETIRSLHEVLKPNMEEQLSVAEDVNVIPPGYLALKPSALVSNPSDVLKNFMAPEWREKSDELVENCSRITEEVFRLNQEFAKRYPDRKAPFFVSTIDAEKYISQEPGVRELQRILFAKYNPRSSRMVSCIGTWQLYLRDSAAELELQRERAQREGYRLGLKLVRGAYLHSEPNRDIIFPSKEATDENFNDVMVKVIQDLLVRGEDSVYGHMVVASHNYHSQMLATMLLVSSDGSYGKANVVLAQLLGMSDNVTHDLIYNHGAKNIIKYVPWGPPEETKDYLLRRLQENGDAMKSESGWPLVKQVAKTLLHL